MPPSWLKDSDSAERLALEAFPMAKHKKRVLLSRTITPRACSFGRRLASAVSRKTIEEDQNHFGGKVDVSRLSFTAGRLFLPDFIDNDAYADEPRTGFLNWAIWAAGAFDFPADQPGYSWGAFAELNQKDWAVRAGYLLMPKVSNSNYFDPDVFGRGEYLLETELRYSLLSHPGKLRLIGWVNSAYSGSYAETLANPAHQPDSSRSDQIWRRR